MTDEQRRRFVIAYLEQEIAKKNAELEGIRRYHASMKSGTLWFLKAWELKYSSDALHRCESRNRRKTFTFVTQELLLLGFSFELLFKSFYVSKHQRLPKKTHALRDLAVFSEVSLKAVDLGLLKRLSRMIWWQGRYPCALNPKDSIADKFSNSDIKSLRRLWANCCRQTPDSIGNEIFDAVKKIKSQESQK